MQLILLHRMFLECSSLIEKIMRHLLYAALNFEESSDFSDVSHFCHYVQIFALWDTGMHLECECAMEWLQHFEMYLDCAWKVLRYTFQEHSKWYHPYPFHGMPMKCTFEMYLDCAWKNLLNTHFKYNPNWYHSDPFHGMYMKCLMDGIWNAFKNCIWNVNKMSLKCTVQRHFTIIGETGFVSSFPNYFNVQLNIHPFFLTKVLKRLLFPSLKMKIDLFSLTKQ